MISKKKSADQYVENGLRNHQRGQIDTAAAEYRRALAVAPDHPDALQLLGTAELQLGQAQDAANHLERALRSFKHHPGIRGNLGHAYLALGRFAEAHAAFRKASELDPRALQFQIGMANASAMQGHLDEAQALLRRILARHPRETLAWFNLGNVLRDQNRHAEAADCYVKATELEPGYADAHNNLGSALHASNQLEAAERAYRACLELDPGHANAELNLASVLIDAGRFAEAEAVARKRVARAGNEAMAHTILGTALSHQGRAREALDCYRLAAQLAPSDARAAEAYASALAGTGRIEEGLTEFARALALDPQSSTARCARGVALLAAGRYAEGWEGLLHSSAIAAVRKDNPDVPFIRTLPDRLLGSSLLLYGDQGLGDGLFFLRFAPALHAAGVKLSYFGHGKMKSLLERAECLDAVLDASRATSLADAAMLLGDLPYALDDYRRRTGASLLNERDGSSAVPPPLALRPLPAQLDAMRTRLRKAGDPPYIGVTWRAGIPPREQSGTIWNVYKAIDPAALAPALRDLPGTLLALQRRPEAGEIERSSAAFGRTLHDFSDLNEDLEAMLALLALIDDYVAVSNTNVHLRASVGRCARVLVPQPGDWRWMLAGSSSPWFPGCSVYRQSLDGDWGEALAALTSDLYCGL